MHSIIIDPAILFSPPLSFVPYSVTVVLDPSMGSVAQFPGSIVSIFIQVFNNKWNLKEAWREAWLQFQMTVLHILGAMLCSSKVSSCDISLGTCFV